MNFFSSFHEFDLRVVPLPQFVRQAHAELINTGVKNLSIQGNIIKGRANWHTAFRCIYQCRLANRVLIQLSERKIKDRQDIYDWVYAIAWENIIPADKTFAVDVQGTHHFFSRLDFAALVVKDALVDRCRSKYGSRPNVNSTSPDIRLHLFLHDSYASILSIDLGNGSLHRRGLRIKDAPAPINEVLAASILEYAEYSPRRPIYDPFCGHGTFLSEACLRAAAIPAGYFRFNQSGESLGIFNKNMEWKAIVAEARKMVEIRAKQLEKISKPIIFGSDIDDSAVKGSKDVIGKIASDFPHTKALASVNIQDALYADLPEDILKTPGLIVTNPPYDMRIKEQNIADLYSHFPLKLKERFPDWKLYVVSGNPEGTKAFSLRTEARIKIFNGPIECTLLSAQIMKKREP